MPDAYDDQGRVNQEKRFSVAMQRYSRDGGESGGKMNPFAEQEAWEQHQIGKATLQFGSKDKKQSAANNDYVSEDQIDFVGQSVMEGDNFEGKMSIESLQESQAKSALEKLQVLQPELMTSRIQTSVLEFFQQMKDSLESVPVELSSSSRKGYFWILNSFERKISPGGVDHGTSQCEGCASLPAYMFVHDPSKESFYARRHLSRLI